MDQIDVVTTATIRPDVLEVTLYSFFRNFLSQFARTRLIINVDPIGEPGKTAEDVLAVCRQFPVTVVHRCPAQPSFSDAVRWGWSQVESHFFLHLEDDWLLKRFVSWEKIEPLLTADESIASVRLNLTRNPNANPPRAKGMSLNPSIVRKKFVSQALPHFNVSLDPEKQLRGLRGPNGPALDHWNYHYYGQPHESSYVVDIGKKWRRSFRLRKVGGGTQPTIWTSDFNRASLTLGFLQLKYRFFLQFWRLLSGCHPAGKPVSSLLASPRR